MPPPLFDEQRLLDHSLLEYAEIHQSLCSTNDRALELCRDESLRLPALVVAEEQTAGRGRQGKSWQSARGSLTFSLLCERRAEKSISELSLQAALAIAMMVESAVDSAVSGNDNGLVAKIKWPNDVYVKNRKIAGLLIESPHTRFEPQRVVIGIGVNVHNDCGCGSDTTFQAVSLAELGASEISLQDALISLVENFDRIEQETATKTKPLKALSQMVNQRCYLTGKQVEVRGGQEHIEGVCEGVDSEGALLVRSVEGALSRVVTGTVVSC